jgi:hypothetical protein
MSATYPYLTYTQYTTLGGSDISESDFDAIEAETETYLDYMTQDRFVGLYEDYPDCLSKCMRYMVDKVNGTATSTGTLSSFSNGVDSYSFRDIDMETELYQVAVRILPVMYISAKADL